MITIAYADQNLMSLMVWSRYPDRVRIRAVTWLIHYNYRHGIDPTRQAISNSSVRVFPLGCFTWLITIVPLHVMFCWVRLPWQLTAPSEVFPGGYHSWVIFLLGSLKRWPVHLIWKYYAILFLTTIFFLFHEFSGSSPNSLLLYDYDCFISFMSWLWTK